MMTVILFLDTTNMIVFRLCHIIENTTKTTSNTISIHLEWRIHSSTGVPLNTFRLSGLDVALQMSCNYLIFCMI